MDLMINHIRPKCYVFEAHDVVVLREAVQHSNTMAIFAIRYLRARFNLDLRDAKDIWDHLKFNQDALTVKPVIHDVTLGNLLRSCVKM